MLDSLCVLRYFQFSFNRLISFRLMLSMCSPWEEKRPKRKSFPPNENYAGTKKKRDAWGESDVPWTQKSNTHQHMHPNKVKTRERNSDIFFPFYVIRFLIQLLHNFIGFGSRFELRGICFGVWVKEWIFFSSSIRCIYFMPILTSLVVCSGHKKKNTRNTNAKAQKKKTSQ